MQAFERRIIGTLLDTGKRLSPAELALHIDDEKFSYLTVGKRLGLMQQKGWVQASVAGPKKTWEVTEAGRAAHAEACTAGAQVVAAAPAADAPSAQQAEPDAVAIAEAPQAEIVLHLFKKPDGSIYGDLVGDDGEIGGVCAADVDGVFDALEDSGQRYDRVKFHYEIEPEPAADATAIRTHTIALPGFTPIEVQGSDDQLVALDALIKTLADSADALDESIGDLELERRQRAEEDAANQRFLERVTRIMGLENTAPNAKEQAIERIADLANRELHRPIHRPRHPLDAAFDDVIEQVTRGKGEQRHGKGAEFWQQPWTRYAENHGIGFLTGQAAKKLDEAQGFMHDQPRWEREMLGVIAYAGMAILKARRDVVAAMKQAV